MTVAELIKFLSKYDSNAKVRIDGWENEYGDNASLIIDDEDVLFMEDFEK